MAKGSQENTNSPLSSELNEVGESLDSIWECFKGSHVCEGGPSSFFENKRWASWKTCHLIGEACSKVGRSFYIHLSCGEMPCHSFSSIGLQFLSITITVMFLGIHLNCRKMEKIERVLFIQVNVTSVYWASALYWALSWFCKWYVEQFCHGLRTWRCASAMMGATERQRERGPETFWGVVVSGLSHSTPSTETAC